MPDSSKLHVLFIPSWYPTPYNPIRGVFFKQQAVALQDAGVKVGVVYPDLRRWHEISSRAWRENHFQTSRVVEDGILTYRFHGWNPPWGRLRAWCWIWLARYLARTYIKVEGRPDILHAQSILFGGVAAQQVGRDFKIPYVITKHSSTYLSHSLPRWQVPYVAAALKDARRLLSVSSALTRQTLAYAEGQTAHIVPNMVDTHFFTPPPTPRRWSETEVFRFVTVALFNPEKGLDVLLRAFAAAFAGHPLVTLELGGDGAAAGQLKALAQELHIAEQVSFLGLLSREQVRDALWRAHAFVLPSHIETFGVVLIEALATGLPVIATRCGGPEDFVTPDVGLLIPPNDVPALAQALRTMVAEYPQYRERASAIRAYAENRFSKDTVTRLLLEHYTAVLHSTTAS